MTRLRRGLLVLAFGVLLAVVTAEAVTVLTMPNPGFDYGTYTDAIRRWLAGGSFYQTYQLAGPYVVQATEVMYPPTVIPMLVPFAALPAVLWWAVPIGILVSVFAYWQPSLLGWVLILAGLAWPYTAITYLSGNPAIWFVAVLGLGTIYHWPSVFVFLKPTLAPFALVGIRHRSWWVALAGLAIASLVFLPLWLDYLAVALNARGPLVSPLYSLQQVPLMLTPVIAKWASTRKQASL